MRIVCAGRISTEYVNAEETGAAEPQGQIQNDGKVVVQLSPADGWRQNIWCCDTALSRLEREGEGM